MRSERCRGLGLELGLELGPGSAGLGAGRASVQLSTFAEHGAMGRPRGQPQLRERPRAGTAPGSWEGTARAAGTAPAASTAR